MDSSAGERRQAFSFWLRTGRLPVLLTSDGLELKFNPWHDWATGRFTFAGSGRYTGGSASGGFTGGGGGSFGGGGATGTWEQTDKRRKVYASRPSASQPSRGVGSSGRSGANASDRIHTPRTIQILHQAALPSVQKVDAARTSAPTLSQPANAPHIQRLVRNGYKYQIDEKQRTVRVSGTLTLSVASLRSRTAQARAGGADRRSNDDGGHYIAARFNGPTEAFNHFAQDSNFNRSDYRVLEDKWAAATKSGKQVSVRITPSYDGASQRPAAIQVLFSIDGVRDRATFPNRRQEKPRGKR